MRGALVCLLLGLPASAFAAGRGELALSGGPAFALLHQDEESRAGAAVDARLVYGLDDVWSAHARVSAAWIPAAGAARTTVVVAPTVGMTAAADVLNWVPFVEAAVGLADLRTHDASEQRLGGAVGGGVDYLVSRHLSVTLCGHAAYWPLRLAGADRPAPLQVTLAIQIGHVF
jgi:uncharacterized protein (DUF697 family)